MAHCTPFAGKVDTSEEGQRSVSVRKKGIKDIKVRSSLCAYVLAK